jgi:hypothetical protein
MIYICYIFCEGGVEICVLTVRDNEHDSENGVGDNEAMLSEVAEGGDTRGKVAREFLILVGNVHRLTP